MDFGRMFSWPTQGCFSEKLLKVEYTNSRQGLGYSSFSNSSMRWSYSMPWALSSATFSPFRRSSCRRKIWSGFSRIDSTNVRISRA